MPTMDGCHTVSRVRKRSTTIGISSGLSGVKNTLPNPLGFRLTSNCGAISAISEFNSFNRCSSSCSSSLFSPCISRYTSQSESAIPNVSSSPLFPPDFDPETPSACCAKRRMRLRDATLRRSDPDNRAASRRFILSISASRSSFNESRNASGFSFFDFSRAVRSNSRMRFSSSRCNFARSRTALAARSAFALRLSFNCSSSSFESGVFNRISSRFLFRN
mmetsp:Transcript_9451/g.17059  ORF Transcript_9451/g.17059 Transcript_9451/m.17059 type:complete len:219 (-) Transcript_9451:1629-2285(-)